MTSQLVFPFKHFGAEHTKELFVICFVYKFTHKVNMDKFV